MEHYGNEELIGAYPSLEKLFEDWKVYATFVPSIQDYRKLSFEGVTGGWTRKYLKYIIERCTGDDCAPEDEIDQFVSSLTVHTYEIKRSVDFTVRTYPPYVFETLHLGAKKLSHLPSQ